MDNIVLGDYIGYFITLIVGLVFGVMGDRFIIKISATINKKSHTIQKNNTVMNGDITGGDKIGR